MSWPGAPGQSVDPVGKRVVRLFAKRYPALPHSRPLAVARAGVGSWPKMPHRVDRVRPGSLLCCHRFELTYIEHGFVGAADITRSVVDEYPRP